MAFSYFAGLWPTTPTTTATTPTLVTTTTETLFAAPRTIYIEQNNPLSTIQQLLFLSTIPLAWYFAYQRRQHLSRSKRIYAGNWTAPWRTTSWNALYGLLALAYDNEWGTNTPFWLYKSIHDTWQTPNRPWLKRLLAMGVIPLHISDGGMSTHRVGYTSWAWRKSWPWVAWPLYQQEKSRACFEFLVPYPDATAPKERFLRAIIENRGEGEEYPMATRGVNEWGYGVSLRMGPPDQGKIYYSIQNPPEREEYPFQVGARSWLEFLLPLKRDKVLRNGYGVRSNRFAYFCRNNNPARVPLLRHADAVIVRLEARHYDVCELDQFVFHLAQKVGLPVQYPEEICRKKALRKLERCELSTEDLKPYVPEELERYR
jgi:hypothetical protein